MEGSILLFIIVTAIVILLSLVFYYLPFGLWLSARASGVKISLLELFFMRLRKTQVSRIVKSLIEAHKAGLDITREMLESHYLAGGNVEKVVQSLIFASKNNVNLSFHTAVAIDLAGHDLWQAVRKSKNPTINDFQ